MGREMLAEEVTEDMPGNLAANAAPERIVAVIAVGNREEDVGYCGFGQFPTSGPCPLVGIR